MADDEHKTLLRIEGDASGAKKAAGEAKSSLQDLGDQSGATSAKQASASVPATQAIEDQAEAVAADKRSFDDFAKSVGTSESEVNALREVLGQVSPELAILGDVAIKGKGAMAALFTPAIMGGAAVLAAVWGVTKAISEMRKEAEEARQAYEEIQAAAQRARGATTERTEDVAEQLARAGISSDAAIATAAGIQRRMRREGFKAEQVQAVLPFAVDAGGQQVLTDEEVQRLAAQEEFAPGQLQFGRTGEMQRVLERAQRRATGRRYGGDVEAQRRAILARSRREQQRVQQFDEAAVGRRLQQEEPGISDEEIDKAIQDMRNVYNKGRLDDSSLKVISAEDRLEYQRRQREAARRLSRMQIISGRRFREVADVSLTQATAGETPTMRSLLRRGGRSAVAPPDVVGEMVREIGPLTGEGDGDRIRRRRAESREASQQQVTINETHHHHGWEFNGGPRNKFRHVPRMTAAES